MMTDVEAARLREAVMALPDPWPVEGAEEEGDGWCKKRDVLALLAAQPEPLREHGSWCRKTVGWDDAGSGPDCNCAQPEPLREALTPNVIPDPEADHRASVEEWQQLVDEARRRDGYWRATLRVLGARPVTCSICEGRGTVNSAETEPCATCDGTGEEWLR